MIIIALSFSVNWLVFTTRLVKSLCGEPLMGPVSLANKTRKRVKTQQTNEFSWNLCCRIYFQKYLEVLVLLRLLLSSYSCWPFSCLHWIAPTEYFTAASFATPAAWLFPLFSIVFHDFPKNWSATHHPIKCSPYKRISDKVCYVEVDRVDRRRWGGGVIRNAQLLQDAVSPILSIRGMQWFGTRSFLTKAKIIGHLVIK